ncbi:hypothetical protein F5884DRAFT_454126 [Xylogone sp. PMI_703]|nr:hypothetical protein F5884DRAFT_454126 [Xylogone sp. PMI_703]
MCSIYPWTLSLVVTQYISPIPLALLSWTLEPGPCSGSQLPALSPFFSAHLLSFLQTYPLTIEIVYRRLKDTEEKEEGALIQTATWHPGNSVSTDSILKGYHTISGNHSRKARQVAVLSVLILFCI